MVCLVLTVQAQPLPTTDPAGAGFSVERLERLSQFLNNEIDRQAIPGAVCLIFRKEKLAHYSAYGPRSLGAETPIDPHSLFYIQSMTKPVISVAIMMLYEEGRFALYDPVSKYLPEFADAKVATYVADGSNGGQRMELTPAKQPITIEQLLTHTAGMLHGLGNSDLDKTYVNALYQQPHTDIESRVKALAALPLVDQPGASWHYSAAPDVLSLLIEHFSGMSTAEFLQQRIFDPLGMADSGYNVIPEKKDRIATLHILNNGKLLVSPQQVPSTGNTVFGGTHGLFSTADDYLKFCRMLLNGGEYNGRRLLSRKTVELMTADHVGNRYPEPGFGFGLGFAVRTGLAAGQRLGSEGQFFWSGAFNTYFFIDPKENLIAILMMQMTPYTSFYNYQFQQLVYQAIAD